jgi:hypothetical protein
MKKASTRNTSKLNGGWRGPRDHREGSKQKPIRRLLRQLGSGPWPHCEHSAVFGTPKQFSPEETLGNGGFCLKGHVGIIPGESAVRLSDQCNHQNQQGGQGGQQQSGGGQKQRQLPNQKPGQGEVGGGLDQGVGARAVQVLRRPILPPAMALGEMTSTSVRE